LVTIVSKTIFRALKRTCMVIGTTMLPDLRYANDNPQPKTKIGIKDGICPCMPAKTAETANTATGILAYFSTYGKNIPLKINSSKTGPIKIAINAM